MTLPLYTQTSVLLVYPGKAASVLRDLFVFMTQIAFFFPGSLPSLKKHTHRILNSSACFLAILSGFTVLLKVASFKVKDAFKWKVVIKNLEQEAVALKEDKRNPRPEPVYFLPHGLPALSTQLKVCGQAPGALPPSWSPHQRRGGMLRELSLALL